MYDRFHAYLRLRRVSITSQRNQVYAALLRLGPCGVQELRKELAGHLPRVTVYRTIELLVEIEVAEMIRQDVIALKTPFRQHVHYLLCSECGRSIGFNDERLEKVLERLGAVRPWEVAHHQVELLGRCATCVAGIKIAI